MEEKLNVLTEGLKYEGVKINKMQFIMVIKILSRNFKDTTYCYYK